MLAKTSKLVSFSSMGCVDKFLSCLFVLGLLFSGCPTAVPWFVVSVTVRETIKAQAARIFAHVSKEVFKFHPALTNRYAASAVAIITRGIGVEASLFHLVPRTKSWRGPSCCMTMFGHNLSMQAPTRTGKAGSQRTTLYGSNVSTLASANPCPMELCSSTFTNNGKTAKPLTDKLEWFHVCLNNMFLAIYARGYS